MSVLHLPLDHESWQEYRRLKAAVGAAAASHFLVRLFVELGYKAQAGGSDFRLGYVEPKTQLLFLDSIQADNKEAAWNAIVQSELLTPFAEGHICGRFVQLNPHLDPSFEPTHVKGWKASKRARELRSYEAVALQQSLLIPESVWTSPDGSRIAHDEIRRIMILIRACDGALGRAERPHNGNGFTQALAQNALSVLREFAPEQIDFTLRQLNEYRGHPAVPPTTEQLLPRFRELANKFAVEQ